MRPITPKIKKVLLAEPNICARAIEGTCQGRITLEHAIIYAGRQVNEVWAIIHLCAFHHAVDEFQDGGDLQKEKNIWLALCRATPRELIAISKAIDYLTLRRRLDKKYQ